MLGYIWAAMITVSYLFGIISGDVAKVTEAALSGAGDAVTMTLSLLGVMCFWSGLMEIAKRSGITEKIAAALSPVIHLLFPELKKDDAAFGAIVMNMIANLLGLSNAATPLGLRAMSELDRKNGHLKEASHAMCMFVVINTASITLVPSTVIAMMSAAGSHSPFDILIPAWLTSAAALAAGVACAKLFAGKDI